MGRSVTLNGLPYTIPTSNDVDWGRNFVDWAQAVSDRAEEGGSAGSSGEATGMVDVATEFGMVGDDSTDNTAAFVALRTWMLAHDGATLWLKPGTYRHKNPYMFAGCKNFHLKANGAYLRNTFDWIFNVDAASFALKSELFYDNQNNFHPVSTGQTPPRQSASIFLFNTVEVGADTITLTGNTFLPFDGRTIAFAVGKVVTGGTSGAVGTIVSLTDHGEASGSGTGALVLSNLTGTFVDNEVITDPVGGHAVVNGTNSTAASKFTVGAWAVTYGFAQDVLGYPPGARYKEYVRVLAVDTALGTVQFRRPLKFRYDSRWWDDGGFCGKPRIAPLTRAVDVPAGTPYGYQVHENIVIEGLGCLDHALHQPGEDGWAAATTYVVGNIRSNDSGKRYIVITAGTSAGSGGPTGTSNDITDGSVHWSHMDRWTQATAFTSGQRRQADARIYRCTTGGTSGTSGPSGTAVSIPDGSCVWTYERPAEGTVSTKGEGEMFIEGCLSATLLGVRAGILTPTECYHFEASRRCELGSVEVDKMLGYVSIEKCDVDDITGGTGCDNLVVKDNNVRHQLELGPGRYVTVENNDVFTNDDTNVAQSSILGDVVNVHRNRFYRVDPLINEAPMTAGQEETPVTVVSATATTIVVAKAANHEPLVTCTQGAVLYTGSLIDANNTGLHSNRGVVKDIRFHSRKISFNSQTANFTVGQRVTGTTSRATGVISSQTDAGATGTLTFTSVSGNFIDNEIITDPAGGSAMVSSSSTVDYLTIEADFEKTPSASDVFYYRKPLLTTHSDNVIIRGNVVREFQQAAFPERAGMYRNNIMNNSRQTVRIPFPPPVYAWVATTNYPLLGTQVHNGGKTYQLIAVGTSAGSGGPTGTTLDITDGSCHWMYLSSAAYPLNVAAINGDVLSVTAHVNSVATAGGSAWLSMFPSNPPNDGSYTIDLKTVGTRRWDCFGNVFGEVGSDDLTAIGSRDGISTSRSQFWRNLNMTITGTPTVFATGWLEIEFSTHS
jgi:hypothetical protein